MKLLAWTEIICLVLSVISFAVSACASDTCMPAQAGTDATSLMQGTHVHIEHMSSDDVQPPLPASRSAPKLPAAGSQSLHTHRDALPGSQTIFAELARHGMEAATTQMLPLMVFVFLVVCLCICILVQAVRRDGGEDQRRNYAQPTFPAPTVRTNSMLAARRPISYLTPVIPATASCVTLGSRIAMPAMPTPPQGYRGSFEHNTQMDEPQMPQTPPTPQYQEEAPSRVKRLPPPLCEAMVLPLCEVRFGFALEQLLNMRLQDELKIVGLSGNTLLRANVKKVHAGHALEILMPEASSAPRAIVRPSAQDSQVFEILGFRGVAYGLLHIRNSNVCYVTHKGQIALTVDTKPGSIQLALKTEDAQSLASVSCGTQSFANSAEHLEIRVEPGVDSVLVLACTLAVLLLSPHHRVVKGF